MPTVIIFGASSGYGAGIAKRLLTENKYVVIGCSRTEPPENTVHVWEQCDVTDFAQVVRVSKKYNYPIEAVVYSAGIAIGKEPVSGKEDNQDWCRVFDTNTIGLLNVARAFKETLEYNGKSTFIHIGSIANRIQYPGGIDYCASKAAASSIMRGLRLEWLGTGIRVTSVEPGLGNTNFQKSRYKGDITAAQKHTQGIKLLEPEDLGNIVSFILALPYHVNIDTLEIKPIDQADHGKLSINAKSIF